MTVVVFRKGYLSVLVDGVPLTGVRSASATHGYDLRVAQAEVQVWQPPAGLVPLHSVVEIIMGATEATAATRFKGPFCNLSRDFYPRGAKVSCKGHLVLAEIYHCKTMNGVDMSGADLSNTGSTDTEYVYGMLNNAGIYDPPVTLTIGGLDRLMGTKRGNRAFVFSESESALAWIQKLDAVCLGYVTYDTQSGAIVRSQISSLPSATPAYTFTEGIDIFRASALDSVLEAKNRVIVTGWSDGKKEDESGYSHHAHWEVEAHNPWFDYGSDEGGWIYITQRISSGMIEKSATAAGDQLACQEVAEWQLAENNVRRLKVTLTTQRDDPISPGTTIAVVSPGRLGMSQNFWVQQVRPSIDAKRHFEQQLTCIGKVAEP